MQIGDTTFDDFKSPRQGISPPLPKVFMIVPLVFYSSVAFLAVVGSTASIAAKFSSDQKTTFIAQSASVTSEIEKTKKARTAINAEIAEATELENWVLASMPLQPLIVEIVRSMGPDDEIVEMSIERDAETPSQLRIGLKLNTASDKQLEKTIAVINRMNYREFNPTQTRTQGNLDYKASLLWQNTDAQKREAPDDRLSGGELKP